MDCHKTVTVLFVSIALSLAACEAREGEPSGPAAPEPATDTAEFPTDPDTGERLCGGIAGLPCGDGEYCQFAEGTCQIADNMGICQPRLDVCTKDYRPVCGCDGRTYGNACTAASFGVSVSHQGPCEDEET